MSTANPSQHMYLKMQESIPNLPRYGSNKPEPVGIMWNVYVVPYFIRQALQRNKLDTIELLDYSKLRRILSITDIAQLMACQYLVYPCFGSIGGKQFFNYSLEIEWQSRNLTNDQKIEINNVLVPLSRSEHVKAEIIDLLAVPNTETDLLAGAVYHKVQLTQNPVFFINIERGFLNALEGRDYSKLFVSDYLKALYSFVSIRQVSYSEIFRDYLELL